MSWAKRRWRWALAAPLVVSAVALASIALGPFDRGSTNEPGAGPVVSDAGDVGEGIQVHGDWVIEVRNEDGSRAAVYEFENALSGFGSHFLDLTLARAASVGEWGVPVIGGTCSPSTSCFITEAGGTHNWGTEPQATFATLELSTQQSPNQFILQGNFDATSDGTISEVHTLGCFAIPPNLDAAPCNNTFTFTATTLQSPVNVIAGQQVLVTVRISFS